MLLVLDSPPLRSRRRRRRKRWVVVTRVRRCRVGVRSRANRDLGMAEFRKVHRARPRLVVLEERRGGRPVVLEARRVGVEHDELVAYCIIRDFVLRPRAGGVAVGTRIADVGETVGGRS